MTGNITANGSASIQLKGAGQLARGLKKAGVDMKDLRDINKQAAQVVAPEAKRLAPKGKSGNLAKSVRAGATQKAGVIRAGSKKRVPYAGVINYGWPKHNIKPTRFANQAAKNTEPQWTRLYEEAVRKIINRITTGDTSK
ncbi:bacteriophage protein, PF04883 family [Bifidobacterium saguini DSM 23967]|uniref:Bacteriophage protein, PF04883 family n=2 Tax=Bifidobacterium saguini TaxID=762210 RepID=A0A087D5Z4_9BIFI|nr:HK97 gp10 family phage protein [Bifidobacterium saguini]KFI90944.1 bacteriophage protein, PF04883 family [Bifidobacterium saguini DSM 23967]QTB91435.1 HK97 gp10 family phage protein [Bifidobacterium saguini]